jgi:hypothetical protein
MTSPEIWVKEIPVLLSEQVRLRELVKRIQHDAYKAGLMAAGTMIGNEISIDPHQNPAHNAYRISTEIFAVANAMQVNEF